MLENSTSVQSNFTSVDAVDDLLRLDPNLTKFRDELLVIFNLAWRGEWPFDFYLNIHRLTESQPWLKSIWLNRIGLSFIPHVDMDVSFYDFHKDSISQWEARSTQIIYRKLTCFSAFEGLLHYSKIHFGSVENECAHRLLGRVLDQIDSGLNSRGSGRYIRRHRHPLKNVFYKIRYPQTIERLAHSLSAIIPEIYSIYPRLGKFIEESILPLACGKPVIWVCPPDFNEDDVLDTDKPPLTTDTVNSLTGLLGPKSDTDREVFLPKIIERAFTVNDLVDEIINYDKDLLTHKLALVEISRAWRGEFTMYFFGAVGEITLRSPWLGPLIQNLIGKPVLVALRRAKNNDDFRHNFARTASNWRENQYVETIPKNRISASFNPKKLEHGLNLLKGLLFLGRLVWEPFENMLAQETLNKLIDTVKSCNDESQSACAAGANVVTQHSLKMVLDSIEIVKTPKELALAIEKIMPEIANFDIDAAILIGQVYLPLLNIPETNAITTSLVQKKDKEKTKSSSKKKTTTPLSEDRRLRINIPTRQTPELGESIEEAAQSICLLRRSEPSKDIIALKEEVRWVHQRIYGSNQLIIRSHIECLSDAEAMLFVGALNARIGLAIADTDSKTGWLCVLLALTLITGQSVRTWNVLEICLNDTGKNAQGNPQLLLSEGILRLPIIRPDGAFKPTESMRSMLEGVSQTVDLHLPPSLRSWLESILRIDKPQWSIEEKDLRSELDELVSELEPDVGTGISLARVRLTARARIRQVTNDLASTMLICGDTFGLSTASLYYTNVNLSVLEEQFRISAWPLFKDEPVNSNQINHNLRVGSELLVTTKTAHSLAWSKNDVTKAIHAKNNIDNNLVIKHNNLVDHILKMLMATTGHRPTSALFELTRFDFDTTKHAAVFSDKQCDPAHLYRYLPTPDLLSVQLDKYLNHLRFFVGSSDINQELKEQAQAAILGTGPIFFHLCPKAKPFLLKFSAWRKTLPSNWQEIPLNWGRTWLASRGREAGIEADHISIILGHLEAVGYPFSNESPLEPAQLSRVTSGPLGNLARSSGWITRNGLNSSPDKNNQLLELGPLKNWVNERKQVADLSKEYKVEQQQVLRSTLRSNREAGEKIVITSLELVLQQPMVEFESLVGLKGNRTVNDKASAEEFTITLTEEDLENTQNKIDEVTAQNKILQIAAHNALHRYLKCAKKKLKWNCPIPSPWLAPATLEPTPFFPGIFRATNQIHALRQHFGQIPVKVPIGSTFTPFEWACGQTIIAMCIFGFIDSENQIYEIINGRQSAVRSSAINDLLLVETGVAKRVVGIRGIASLALARLKMEYPDNILPNVDELNSVISFQLPSTLSGNSSDVINRLCATVSVSNIVELSSLARKSLKQISGCVAMSVARQRQILEDGFGLPEEITVDSPANHAVINELPMKRRSSSKSHEQYRKLRDTLYIGEGPKTFNNTEEHLTQANIGAFRNPLCRELTAFLKNEDLDPLVACIGAFALHLTTNGTPKTNFPAWSTIYTYITSFGIDLVDIATDVDFLNLEEEEFIDLYQDVIDRKTTNKSRWLAARELVNFHRYLQAHHGFENVDFSDLEGLGERPEIQVDAEVIQPKEFAIGLEIMNSQAVAYDLMENTNLNSLRTNRQLEVYGLLLRHSRARHNELSALRFKDVLANYDSVILFIRSSRYRRLKTPAACRIVDISNRATPHQRAIITNWINAEKIRLGNSWKDTLPILGLLEAPKDRLPSREIRELTLSALADAIGCRTKIHRSRHLGACEDMLGIWLSDEDLKAIINASMTIHLPSHEIQRPSVLLPRHTRELSLGMGHRRSSTTIINYFHIPWALTSRAHHGLSEYFNSHVASVALGTGYSNAFKIGYRANKKLPVSSNIEIKPIDSWLTYLIDKPTPTPGKSISQITNNRVYTNTNTLKGRDVERLLRDIQRGISPNEAGLAHGITPEQLHRLKIVAESVQIKVGFRIWPINGNKQRSARAFQEAGQLVEILDLMDRDKFDPDRQLLLSVSHSYLIWAWKGTRDKIMLPNDDAKRMTQLLSKLKVAPNQIIVTESEDRLGFSNVKVIRSEDSRQLLNHSLAWILVISNIVEAVNEG